MDYSAELMRRILTAEYDMLLVRNKHRVRSAVRDVVGSPVPKCLGLDNDYAGITLMRCMANLWLQVQTEAAK